MKFKAGIKTEFERIMQWLFRAAVVLAVAYYFVGTSFLPVENDEAFEVNLAKKYDFEITEEDVLYKGSFKLLRNNNTTEDITIPATVDAKPGEKVTIISTIPDDFDSPYIGVRSSQEDLTIFIDGKARVIYNTKDTRPFGTQTTSRYVLCRTSADDAGKELRITVSSGNASYAGVLNPVYAADRFIFWEYIFQGEAVVLVLSVIALAIGLFLIIIGFILSQIVKIRTGLENAGYCIFFVGLWVISESKIRQLFMPNSSAGSNMAFIVIMLAAVPFLQLVNYLQKNRYKRIYRGLGIAAFANIAVQIILQLSGYKNFLDMLPVSHLVLLVSMTVAISLMAYDAKTGKIREYRVMSVGVTVMLICLLCEMVSTYLVTKVSGIFVVIGMIIFTLCALYDTFERYREHERNRHEARLAEQRNQSEALTLRMILTLSEELESKDEFKKGHSSRVAEYSGLIAREAGVPESEIKKIKYAAALHDIGKVGIPDTILHKPGKLTEEEYSIIKTHTENGAKIVDGIKLISYVGDIVRYHHEKYNGEGYPDGLKGEEIPYYARIVAIADAYDAMSTGRIYRSALDEKQIREKLISNRGEQFDPELADMFITMLDEGRVVLTGDRDYVNLLGDADADTGTDASHMFGAVMDNIRSKTEGENIDFLTGLKLRNKGMEEVNIKMQSSSGAIVFFDMDNLKTVNDLYGHKAGDAALKGFAEILAEEANSLISFRAGGDEFITYYEGASNDDTVGLIDRVIEKYERRKEENSKISRTSISVGIYMTHEADDVEGAVAKADKALYYVKKNGKKGYAFYGEMIEKEMANSNLMDLETLVEAIETAGNYTGSLNIEYREFTKLYEYIVNVSERYGHTAHLVLVTLDSPGALIQDDLDFAMECMGKAIQENIRTVDVCTRYTSSQHIVILFEAGEDNIFPVMQRIFARYQMECKNVKLIPSYQSKMILKNKKN